MGARIGYLCHDTVMARAVLINAIDVPYTVSCLMPDNGLALLAACLLQREHEVEVWDPGTVATLGELVDSEGRRQLAGLLEKIQRSEMDEDMVTRLRAMDRQVVDGLRAVYQRLFARLEQRVAGGGVDFVGLKLWMGAGYRLALELCADLRTRHPRVKVFAGGPVAGMAPSLLLTQHPVLDGVCVGDGERTVVGLAEHCEGRRALADVPNLAWRDGGDGVRLPRPSFADLDQNPQPCYAPQVYASTEGDQCLSIPCIDESRGCPMGCSFCAHSRLSGGRWRLRAVDHLLAEMDSCRQQLGARAFRFSGSYTPAKVYRAVAEGILASGEPTLFSGFAHVGGVREADLPRLRQAGLVALFLGIESGAPELLSGPLGKKVRPDRMRQVIRACLDAGIFVSASVIFPAPGETDETEAATLGLLTELMAGRDDCSVPVQPAFPQPGSLWWDELERFGFAGDKEELLAAICGLRVRHLLPVSLWEPLPYQMAGQPIAAHTPRTVAAARELEALEIMTGMADEAVLIGAAAGYSPRQFQALQRRIFVTADADAMQEIILRVRRGNHRGGEE